jgi:cytochrome P450
MHVRIAEQKKIPTARGRLPILGHALPLYRDPLGFISSLSAHGELVKIYIGTLPAYVPTTPALVRELLVADDRTLDKGRLLDKTRPLLGNGLISSSGDHHRWQRRLMQPAFHRGRIASYAETMREAFEQTASTWAAGRPIVLDREITALSLSVVASTLFSARPDSGIAAAVHEALPTVLRGTITRTLYPEWFQRLPAASSTKRCACIPSGS